MNAILDFPVIAEPTPATVPATIKATVLAQFTATEGALRTLAAKYRDVAFDCATPKGLAAAKEARLDLRENGRYLVERAEKRIKTEVNDLKKTMADEVDRLVSIVRPAEDAIHAQIVAREEQLAAERAEAERQAAEAARLDAERKQRHDDGIATLEGYVVKARGKTAAQMASGISFVEKIVIDPAHWQEYTERAAMTLADTLAALRVMHATAVQAEHDAAELAALRAEKAARDAQERREREQAAAVAAAAEAEAQRARDGDAARALLAAAAAPPVDTYLPASTVTEPLVPSFPCVATPEGDRGPAPVLSDKAVADASARAFVDRIASTAAEPLEPSADAPTMVLGDINARLGFIVTADFIFGLGFKRQVRIGRGVHFLLSDWPAIKAAMVKHILALA